MTAATDKPAAPAHTAWVGASITFKQIEGLLKQGADPNATDELGLTPLHRAIDDVELIKLLLSYGAEVNAPDPNGDTVLMKVCRRLLADSERSHNSIQVLRQTATVLIKHGARVDVMSAVLLGDINLIA